ncbi:Uncharacterised protein [Raoultella terrigena]|uniref:Uncharacterized protein n=1 Tax=Raoultella terrigena TaxID=577 RepID=A0A3P8M1I9_RAOTE|nr:Uncharacterised protein [Raoultella terrigena]
MLAGLTLRSAQRPGHRLTGNDLQSFLINDPHALPGVYRLPFNFQPGVAYRDAAHRG